MAGLAEGGTILYKVVVDTSGLVQGTRQAQASLAGIAPAANAAGGGLTKVADAGKRTKEETEKASSGIQRFNSSLSVGVGFLGQASAGTLGLVSSFTGLERAQVKVEAMSKRNNQALFTLHTAQEKLTKLEQSGTATAQQLADARQKVALAEQGAGVASQRLELAQKTLNESIAEFAAHALPEAIQAVTGLVAGLGAMSGSMPKLSGLMKTSSGEATAFGGAISKVAGVFRGLPVAMGPVGIALAAIGAVLLAVSTNFMGFHDWLDKTGEALGNMLPFLRPVLDALGAFGNMIDITGRKNKEAVKPIEDHAAAARDLGITWKGVTYYLQQPITAQTSSFDQSIAKINADAKTLSTNVSKDWQDMGTSWNTFVNLISQGDLPGALSLAAEAVPKYFSRSFDNYIKANQLTWEKFTLGFSIWAPRISAPFVAVWNNIQNTFQDVGDWFTKNVEEPISLAFWGTVDQVAGVWTEIVTSFQTDLQGMSSWLNTNVITPITNFFTGLPDAVKGIGIKIAGVIETDLNNMKAWIKSNIIDPIPKFFNGIPDQLSSIAGKILEKLGLTDLSRNLVDFFKDPIGKAQQFAGYIADTLKNLGKIPAAHAATAAPGGGGSKPADNGIGITIPKSATTPSFPRFPTGSAQSPYPSDYKPAAFTMSSNGLEGFEAWSKAAIAQLRSFKEQWDQTQSSFSIDPASVSRTAAGSPSQKLADLGMAPASGKGPPQTYAQEATAALAQEEDQTKKTLAVGLLYAQLHNIKIPAGFAASNSALSAYLGKFKEDDDAKQKAVGTSLAYLQQTGRIGEATGKTGDQIRKMASDYQAQDAVMNTLTKSNTDAENSLIGMNKVLTTNAGIYQLQKNGVLAQDKALQDLEVQIQTNVGVLARYDQQLDEHSIQDANFTLGEQEAHKALNDSVAALSKEAGGIKQNNEYLREGKIQAVAYAKGRLDMEEALIETVRTTAALNGETSKLNEQLSSATAIQKNYNLGVAQGANDAANWLQKIEQEKGSLAGGRQELLDYAKKHKIDIPEGLRGSVEAMKQFIGVTEKEPAALEKAVGSIQDFINKGLDSFDKGIEIKKGKLHTNLKEMFGDLPKAVQDAIPKNVKVEIKHFELVKKSLEIFGNVLGAEMATTVNKATGEIDTGELSKLGLKLVGGLEKAFHGVDLGKDLAPIKQDLKDIANVDIKSPKGLQIMTDIVERAAAHGVDLSPLLTNLESYKGKVKGAGTEAGAADPKISQLNTTLAATQKTSTAALQFGTNWQKQMNIISKSAQGMEKQIGGAFGGVYTALTHVGNRSGEFAKVWGNNMSAAISAARNFLSAEDRAMGQVIRGVGNTAGAASKFAKNWGGAMTDAIHAVRNFLSAEDRYMGQVIKGMSNVEQEVHHLQGVINSLKGKEVEIHVKYRVDPRPANVVPAASGFHGIVSKATPFLTGEAGPERVDITPVRELKSMVAKTKDDQRSRGGGGTRIININVNTHLDKRKMASELLTVLDENQMAY